MRLLHLRPHSFATFHLRLSFESCSFATFHWRLSFEAFIWDHIYMRIFFIWDHIHLWSHSFYAAVEWSCFDFLCVTFLWSAFHFFTGNLKLCKVTPFRVQGRLTLGCTCTRTLKHRGDQKTLRTSGLFAHSHCLACAYNSLHKSETHTQERRLGPEPVEWCPSRKIFAPLEKCVGHILKLLDIVWKFVSLSENSSLPLVSQAGSGPGRDF